MASKFVKMYIPVFLILILALCILTIPCSASAPFFNYDRNGTILTFGGEQNFSDLVTINKTTTSLYIYDTCPFASDLTFTFPFYGATRLPQIQFSYPCDVTFSYNLVFNSGNIMPISSNQQNVTFFNLGSIDNSTVSYITDLIINAVPDYTVDTDPNNPIGIWLINPTVSGSMFSLNTAYNIYVNGTCNSVGDIGESISFDRLRFYRNNNGLYCTADDTDDDMSWDLISANEILFNSPVEITSTPSDSLMLSFLQTNGTKQGAPHSIDIAIDLPQIAKNVNVISKSWSNVISNLKARIANLEQVLSEDFTPFDWLVNGVDAFLDADFGIGVTLGGLLGIIFGFAIVFILLRLWGGG